MYNFVIDLNVIDWWETTLIMKYMQESILNSIATAPSTGHTSLLCWIAQLDRFSSQKPISEIQLAKLLPDNDVMANLVRNWSVIVSRVITKYLQPFRQLRDVVVRHIPHEYSKEMSQKSDSVSSSLNTVCAVTLFLGLLTLPN